MKSYYYVVVMVFSVLLLFLAPATSFYFLYSLVGNLFFWSSITALALKTGLRRPLSYVRGNFSKSTLGIFVGYLSLHYFAYSIALERILTGVFGELFSVSSPFLTFQVTQFYPTGLYSTFANLVFNPSLVVGFPPNYYIELSFYAMSMGFLIATLVTANLLRVRELTRVVKVKVILLAPILGVIGGGSCCVSIPILLASAIPAANLVLASPIGDSGLLLAYVLLPPITALALKLNFDSLSPSVPKRVRMEELKPKK